MSEVKRTIIDELAAGVCRYGLHFDWLGRNWKELTIRTLPATDLECLMTGCWFVQVVTGTVIGEDGQGRPATEVEIDEVMERLSRILKDGYVDRDTD